MALIECSIHNLQSAVFVYEEDVKFFESNFMTEQVTDWALYVIHLEEMVYWNILVRKTSIGNHINTLSGTDFIDLSIPLCIKCVERVFSSAWQHLVFEKHHFE